MIFNFPQQPTSRIYIDNMTPEQKIIMNLVTHNSISKNGEDILIASIKFYKKAFEFLKSIDLQLLVENDLDELLKFLNSVFNFELTIQNKINFNFVFRVTNVSEKFLENGKVRRVGFIKNPPKNIIRKNGVYGRANSPNSTIFYCAFEPGVAILETKPKIGQRIIIAKWYNEGAKDFISYPITNNKNIDNDSLKSATKAFQNNMKHSHPLLREIMDLYLEFLSSEFVKDIEIKNPKKYEYLFSAYFSDRILNNSFNPIQNINHYDCIIYPSIAINYKSENLAIIPKSLPKLRPCQLEDCIVLKTNYNNPDLSNNKLPIARKVLRTSTSFDGDRIIWDDDEN